jgi:hypothetical protein
MAFSIAVQRDPKFIVSEVGKSTPTPDHTRTCYVGLLWLQNQGPDTRWEVNGEPLSRFHHFVSTLLKELERSAVCGLSVLPHMTSPMGTLHRLLKP